MNSFARVSRIVTALMLLAARAPAQPWSYNFGTGTGSWTAGVDSTSFLPAPDTHGGKARVRVGTGNGGFSMESQVITFGSLTYLRCTAPTSGSINKFSIYNYTPAQTFTVRFRIRLGGSDGSATAASGTWYFFTGDGANFSDNSTFSGTQVFTGIRWVFGAGSRLTTKYRNGAAWSNAGLDSTVFAEGQEYLVELYGNNSPAALPYTYNGARSVAPNAFDLWINGTLAGDDLPKGLLVDGANIDSWMFYGESSTGNAANLFLDDFSYANSIADTPLPVQLAAFHAVALNPGAVLISWQTLSEVENYGFEVEKSTGEAPFAAIEGSFVAGHGTTNAPYNYTYTDNAVQPGTWRYRLRQIGLDGSLRYSEAVPVELSTSITDVPKARFSLEQNFPNPFNPTTDISFNLSEREVVSLKVFDVLGGEVRTLVDRPCDRGVHHVIWDGMSSAGVRLPSGLYMYRLTAERTGGSAVQSTTKRMLLLR